MLLNGRTALAAGAANNNFFAGSYIEFLPENGLLNFGFTTGDLAGITIADIEVDILVGNDAVAQNILPRALGATPQMPIWPDDFLASCECLAGDRIVGKVRNLDAANAAALYWTVIYTPMG